MMGALLVYLYLAGVFNASVTALLLRDSDHEITFLGCVLNIAFWPLVFPVICTTAIVNAVRGK